MLALKISTALSLIGMVFFAGYTANEMQRRSTASETCVGCLMILWGLSGAASCLLWALALLSEL